MKVVSAKQMKRIESLAYRDGASEMDFMEEAGSGVALVVHDYVEQFNIDKHVVLLCGKGNNAGDAYVAGVHLLHLDYEVIAWQIQPLEDCSYLCRQNYERFLNEGGRVETTLDKFSFPDSGVIIDGLFGTGFHGDIEEPVASAILAANQSHLPIISVDIPSGLNGETGVASPNAITAVKTAFLGLPKTGFFLQDGWNHVGVLHYVDFGLSQNYIDSAKEDMVMLFPDMLKPLLPPLVRSRHKYQAGQVIGLAGSLEFPGAAVLASLASLRGGAGIVRLLHPDNMKMEISASPYELIKIPYRPEEVSMIIQTMNKATATFVGPGLGVNPVVKKLLREVFPKLVRPCVIDADALTILAEEKIKIPPNSILTPHLGEMKRLLNITEAVINMEFLLSCAAYAKNNGVTLVLKGGPTFIFNADDDILVNPRGDPGMATAGSGDVLTGLIAALLAQGLMPKDAAALGVYLHGVAGETAAMELTSYSMIASDIINFFPEAFDPSSW